MDSRAPRERRTLDQSDSIPPLHESCSHDCSARGPCWTYLCSAQDHQASRPRHGATCSRYCHIQSQPFLPSSPSEAPSCVSTRPLCRFGPYSPPTRTLEPGSLRDASPGRPQTRRPVRSGLSLCHCYLPSRCSPIRLSNTLSTIVTSSRIFVATWFKPLLAYTWLPAMDVAGTSK